MIDADPMKAHVAGSLAKRIVEEGEVFFSGHALKRMGKRRLSRSDVVNIIRGGKCCEAEWENGGWRYRIETPYMWVAVEFESETELVVCTAARYES